MADARWYAVSIFFLAYLISIVDRQLLSLLLVPIQNDLKVSDALMSALHGFTFGNSLSMLAGGVLFAAFSDVDLALPFVGRLQTWQLVFVAIALPGIVVAALYPQRLRGLVRAAKEAAAVAALADRPGYTAVDPVHGTLAHGLVAQTYGAKDQPQARLTSAGR